MLSLSLVKKRKLTDVVIDVGVEEHNEGCLSLYYS